MSANTDSIKEAAVGSQRALLLLASAVFLGMAPWFSASASVPFLRVEWNLNDSGAAALVLAVQLGFVAGTLLSAIFNLPDVLNTRRLFAISAFAGALSNAAFGLFAHEMTTALVCRFLTGMFLAGVYPPGMKIMATWFRVGRGMAIGVLIGALTLGKSSPYLINSFGSQNWRQNMVIVSIFASVGAIIVALFVGNGPYALPPARFDLHQVKKIFQNRSVRLANFGYFGHMWELYAMWTWAPVMIRASFTEQGSPPQFAEFASFIVLGAGAVGCVAAGILADRIGRTVVTSLSMAISGSCCILIGLLYNANPLFLLAAAAVWGASVVADSAQFSTCVTELGEPQYMGTALTIQVCIGFLITMASIEMIPLLVETVGWRYAFIALAPGPLFGVVSMLRLRAMPESVKIAHGRR